LPDQITPEMNGIGSMFSNYFPPQAMSSETENLWSNGFKRPLDLYSESFAAAYCQNNQPTQCKFTLKKEN
jgi:hypothetical protein